MALDYYSLSALTLFRFIFSLADAIAVTVVIPLLSAHGASIMLTTSNTHNHSTGNRLDKSAPGALSKRCGICDGIREKLQSRGKL